MKKRSHCPRNKNRVRGHTTCLVPTSFFDCNVETLLPPLPLTFGERLGTQPPRNHTQDLHPGPARRYIVIEYRMAVRITALVSGGLIQKQTLSTFLHYSRPGPVNVSACAPNRCYYEANVPASFVYVWAVGTGVKTWISFRMGGPIPFYLFHCHRSSRLQKDSSCAIRLRPFMRPPLLCTESTYLSAQVRV